MDLDAILESSIFTLTGIYQVFLSLEEYQHKHPTSPQAFHLPASLSTKPIRHGSVIYQKYGLGHGCFNMGVLLWRCVKKATRVSRAWWASRHHTPTQNFIHQGQPFYGWGGDKGANDKMSTQNWLIYNYLIQMCRKLYSPFLSRLVIHLKILHLVRVVSGDTGLVCKLIYQANQNRAQIWMMSRVSSSTFAPQRMFSEHSGPGAGINHSRWQ
jgi:hypothetical protein